MTASVENSGSGSVAGADATSSSTQSPNGASAGAAAGSNGETMGTTIGSMGELKQKAPKVYNMMMMGIAMTICNEMKHHQERLKELMRQGNRDAGYR